jgi:hypothetical protein
MLNLDVGLSAKLDRENAIGPLPGSFPVEKINIGFQINRLVYDPGRLAASRACPA